MQRRPKGDGSVYWDPDREKWIGVLEAGRGEDGRRKRRKVSADTKTGCREKLAALTAELNRTGMVGRRDITVETVIRDLMAHPPEEWRSPSTIQMRARLAEVIIAMIGPVRLVKLTVRDVEAMLRKIAGDGYSRAYLAYIRSTLRKAIVRAERDGVIGRNVAALAKVPGGPRRQSQAMTYEQVDRLLALDLTPWWRAYVLVAVTMGLRPGELLGLRWEDVDTDAGQVLRVRTSLKYAGRVRDGGGWKIAGLKNEHSRRSQRLAGVTARALRDLRAAQAASRLRLGGDYKDHGLVFCSRTGTPQHAPNVREGFNNLCMKAGIGHWQLRELRHTYVSQLSDSGVSIEVISDAVGHKNSTITREVYRHQIADVISHPGDVMDRIYGSGNS
jgi:integrase